MSRSSVLSAAVALHDFTVDRVAAYCDADHDEIAQVLRSCEGLLERVDSLTPGEQTGSGTQSQRWRVVDARRLREVIGRDATAATRSRAPWAATGPADGRQHLRLLRAEETLFDCADEPSPQVRRIMAATAMNYLRQYVAAGSARQSWWEIELDAQCCPRAPQGWEAGPAGPRLWVDVALANLTELQASGRDVSGDFLIRTATEVCNLGEAMDKPRLQDVLDRFVDLAGDLTRLSVDDVPRPSAPIRLMSALAWRRVRAHVEPDVGRASQDVVSLLRWLDHHPAAGEVAGPGLFHFRDHLADGWNRITVYSDLLQILPSQYAWQPKDELVPGVLVEAVADGPAVSHLEASAVRLEANLVQAPWGSDSALIGIAAQVFEDLAATSAQLDRGVIPRCVQTRRELLTLADVRTRAPAAAASAGPAASAGAGSTGPAAGSTAVPRVAGARYQDGH